MGPPPPERPQKLFVNPLGLRFAIVKFVFMSVTPFPIRFRQEARYARLCPEIREQLLTIMTKSFQN